MLSVMWDIEEAVKRLTAIRDRLDDLRPAWRTALIYLRRATKEQFASQGGRSGDGWAPLTPAYAARKARIFPGKPILRATDAMFNSLIGQTENTVVEFDALEFTYGTRDPKARYHQDGTPRMARRRILTVTEEDRRQLRRIANAYIRGQQISGI